MEFCGWSHDYFSRVKAADTNKILEDLPAAARPMASRAGPTADFMGFNG
jgi:hypothetical protein